MPVVRRLLAALTSMPGRVLISAGLLALVAASIDWQTLGETISGANWGWFVLAVAFVLAALGVGGVRWHFLLRAARIPVNLRTSVRAYVTGAFSNSVLPTAIGGEFVRAWLVARSGRPLARALTSVVADRISALACLLVLAWLGVGLDSGAIPGSLATLLGIATAGMLFAGVAVIVILRRGGLGHLLPKWLRPWAVEVASVLRDYGRDRDLLVRVFLLGLAFQILTVGSGWAISEALGLGLDPEVLAVVIPLALIATLVPISLAGFGVREGAFIALLAEVGVPAADATLFSLLSFAAITIASTPGAIALLVRREPLHVPPDALEPR
jgi:glycosyltransferase 2 family protein